MQPTYGNSQPLGEPWSAWRSWTRWIFDGADKGYTWGNNLFVELFNDRWASKIWMNMKLNSIIWYFVCCLYEIIGINLFPFCSVFDGFYIVSRFADIIWDNTLGQHPDVAVSFGTSNHDTSHFWVPPILVWPMTQLTSGSGWLHDGSFWEVGFSRCTASWTKS